MVNSDDIVIFIRGSPTNPACSASRQMIEQLDQLEIRYKSYDVLYYQRLKEWLKHFANWPQFP